MNTGKVIQETIEKLLGKSVPTTKDGKINKRFVPKKYRHLLDDFYDDTDKAREDEIKTKLKDLLDNLKK